MRLRHLFLVVAVLLVQRVSNAAEISVTLTSASAEFKLGETPRFSVTVQALAPTVKIWKNGSRRLTILKDGKHVDVPVRIADPAPPTATDYMVLVQDQKWTFAHDGAPLVLTQLAAGQYAASIKVWPDWNAEPVESNTVVFRMK